MLPSSLKLLASIIAWEKNTNIARRTRRTCGHTPPPPVARRGSRRSPPASAPLRAGSDPPRPAHKRHPRPCPPLRPCMLRGSGQPAPPACRARLSPAGFAVCPSRRSHTLAAPSAPRGAAHPQPPLWAWPDARETGAGRVGSSRRRALRYGRWAAAFLGSSTGGGGVWAPPEALPGGRMEARPVSPTTTGARARRAIPDAPWARDSREAACGGLVASPT